jgi:tetratricopeptide (TPR) repeat protein/4-amino-4-deoxy-L-arabinose transferase-like glycosyltransferase
LVFFFAVGLSVLNDVFIYIPDSARYLVWAESLSQFHGFTDASGPDPIRYVVHAPLYAVILTPSAFLAAGGVAGAKVLTLVFGLVLLFLINRYLKEHVSKTAALIGTLFLALNPLQLVYSTQILSDVPFASVFVAILILSDRVVTRPPRIDGQLILIAILLSAAMLLREVGVALVVACALLFLVRREYTRMAVLILVPLSFYAVWLLRNEVLVAGLEHPPLRNSDLFSSHLYTVRDAPLISELFARISSNFHAYSGIAGKLLLFTQYDVRGYGIIPPGEFAFGWLLKNTGLLLLPTSLLSFGLFILGLWSGWKRKESTKIVVFFLALYLPLILIYPFNDIRFLFPLLVLMLVFAVIGIVSVIERIQGGKQATRSVLAAGVFSLFLLAIPNCAWIYSFVDNNNRYRSDPESYFLSVVDRADAPELLMFPMSKVGEWLSANAQPSAVIAARWKQLSFWLNGRKLLELNPLLPVEQFENQLRDYQVGYLVVVLDRSRLREFETQMALSSRFSFTPVHRVGNAVIIKVESPRRGYAQAPMDTSTSSAMAKNGGILDSLNRADEQTQYLFRTALPSMESGNSEQAERIFESLSTRAGRSGTVVLHTAVARSFAGKYQAADTLLRNIREGQQAGPLLVHSWYHLQIIERLRQAERAKDPSERADLLTKAAADYWSLGFRQQAERTLKKAIESDAGFPPALVFGIYYSLLREDTLCATQRLQQLRAVAFSHPTIASFENLLSNALSAAKERDVAKWSALRETAAHAYERLGLTESAIDELAGILVRDPSRLSVLRSLARIYVEKERYAPAKRILDQIAEIDAKDAELKRLRIVLGNRWGE